MRQGVTTGRSKLFKEVRAADGTRKFLLQLHDGYLVETVGIPLDDTNKSRLTVCVSSQARRCSLFLHMLLQLSCYASDSRAKISCSKFSTECSLLKISILWCL